MHSLVPIPISSTNSRFLYLSWHIKIYRYLKLKYDISIPAGSIFSVLGQGQTKTKTASRRPHSCQTNHTHTVPRRKRPIYFWLLQYEKVYISRRGRQPQLLAFKNASHVPNQSQQQSQSKTQNLDAAL